MNDARPTALVTRRRLSLLWRIGWRNQLWFVACLVALAVCRFALDRSRYRLIERLTPTPRRGIAPDPVLARLAWMIPRAARFVPRATCLTQASATRLLLALRGYESELRVGAAHTPQAGFEAHAWLLSGPTIIVGGTAQDLARFTPFPRAPGR